MNSIPWEQTADLLEKAADLIETVGHAKGSYVATNEDNIVSGYCLYGAMTQAVYELTGDTGIFDPAEMWGHKPEVRAAAFHVKMKLWNNPIAQDDDLMRWNDRAGRKPDQVIDLLKHTAKDLRNRKAAT